MPRVQAHSGSTAPAVHTHSHDSDLTGVSADDHHAQSHSHASHSGVGANDHHTAFVQADHDALANPHHSNASDHAAVTVGTGLDVTGQLVELDLSEVAAGGELAGTMDAPTVDATHSGSTHAATQAAAEATAAAANTADIATHAGLADPHTGYRLESADHTHASTGAQAGTVSHDVLTGVSSDDHHAQAHGASDHTDVTRSIFIPARAGLAPDTAVGSTVGTTPDLVSTVNFEDAVTDEAYGHFQVPRDWASGTLTLRWHFSMNGTSATPDLRLNVGYLEMGNPASGNTMVGAATRTALSQVASQYLDFTLGTPSAAGELWKFVLVRLGGNAADTYANTMRALGVEILYTATQ